MPFQTSDPATGAVTASYEYATDVAVKTVVERLSEAQADWQSETWGQRQAVLRPLTGRMESEKENLARLISNEMGKPVREARDEVSKCLKTIERILQSDLSFIDDQKRASAIYSSAVVQQKPLGVIYSIMPWNLPLWQAVRMVMPALLAGNTILLKHSELTPKTGLALQRLFAELYPKPLLLNVFASHEQTEDILADSRVGGVSLTGSVGAGRKVYETAAKYFKKAVLELGGSDPYVVLPDADLEVAAQLIAKGRLLNAGQTCISVKRCLVARNILDDFLVLLKKEFDKAVYGAPLDEKTTLGPLAHRRFKDSLQLQLQELRNRTGAQRVYAHPHGQSPDSAYVDAEIYLLSENSDWLRDQEIFAPVLLVMPYDTAEQAVEIANATEFALGAGVIGRDLVRAQQVAEKIHAGHVAINSLVATDLSLPFGGFKSSGLGRELGHEAYFEFLQTKVIASA